MMADETLGSKLLALKERSRLSLDNIAKAAGYSRASSIQRYFSIDYDAKYLPRALADRLKEALIGFGDPPVYEADIDRLTEFGFLHDRRLPQPLAPHMLHRAVQTTIECNASYPDEMEGIDVEVFRIADDPLRYFARPEHLRRRPLSAFYVSTMTMSPRYRLGEIVVVENERPAQLGQDVLVYLRSGDDGEADFYLLATLAHRDREKVTLEVLNPAGTLTLPHRLIDAISPILGVSELLTPDLTQHT